MNFRTLIVLLFKMLKFGCVIGSQPLGNSWLTNLEYLQRRLNDKLRLDLDSILGLIVILIGVALKLHKGAKVTKLSLRCHQPIILIRTVINYQLLSLLIKNWYIDMLLAKQRQFHCLLYKALLPFTISYVAAIIVLDHDKSINFAFSHLC